MPNFDGGHYFLTALIPLRSENIQEGDRLPQSAEQLMRNALISLPTAEQSLGAERVSYGQEEELNSPFAVGTRTHLARFVVIDDVVYNGREPENSIIAQATGSNPLVPQKVDTLNAHYMLFSADFDADSGAPTELCSYLTELWEGSKEQLRSVFKYCLTFDEKVKSASDFCDYILSCQIETTMPFNDYWQSSPPLKDLPIKPPGVVVGVCIAAAVLSLCAWLLNATGLGLITAIPPLVGTFAGLALTAIFGLVVWKTGLRKTSCWIYLLLFLSALVFFTGAVRLCTDSPPWGWITIALGALSAIGVYALYAWIMSVGRKPFPTAPDSKLPDVLKALYLQEHFTRFAIDAQGASDETLYENFGKFLEQTKPLDVSGPTQSPGQLKSEG